MKLLTTSVIQEKRLLIVTYYFVQFTLTFIRVNSIVKMDNGHVFNKIINLFWKKKCVYCKKIKLFKQLFKCSCDIICHRKCHEKFIQTTKTEKVAVVESSMQHGIKENTGEDLKVKENYENSTNQVQNTILVV